MADSNTIVSMIAGGAITEFALVKINGAGKVEVATLATADSTFGVAQRAASAGEAVDVVIHGVTRVISGAALTLATTPILAVTTAGKVQACQVADTTFFPVARALPNVNQLTTADGDQMKVFFFGPVSRAS